MMAVPGSQALVLGPAFGAPAPARLALPVVDGAGRAMGGNGGGPAHGLLEAARLRPDPCTRAAGAAVGLAAELTVMDELRGTCWPNPVLRRTARAACKTITLIPCRDPAGQAWKMQCAAQGWVAAVMSGRAPPSPRFTRFMATMGAALSPAICAGR